MNSDAKTNEILRELVKFPNSSSKSIMDKFNLSRGQMDYRLKKINDYLETLKMEEISRTRNGYFTIPLEVLNYFKTETTSDNQSIKSYVFSPEERVLIIILIVLSQGDYLSLNHLTDALSASRNTILRDLKDVRKKLKSRGLSLNYSRNDGYSIQGVEWECRQLLLDIMMELLEMVMGYEAIKYFTDIDEDQLDHFTHRIELAEKELDIQFTDEKMKVLPILMILIIRRAQAGHHLADDFAIQTNELLDTQEYFVADRVIWDIEGLPENERIYITLLLLTTNLSSGDILSNDRLSEMMQALEETINIFEMTAGVLIEDKATLLNRLLIHMRPAYYRIKYGLNLQSKYFMDNTDQHLFSMFYILKEAAGPLNDYFGQEIPDTELFLISLYIGSYLVDVQPTMVNQKWNEKAIIVCPNGISIALILEKTLKDLFPELNFLGTVSVRDFYKLKEDYDLVFSSVPLETNKDLFVVNNYLSDQEKAAIRQNVLKTVGQHRQNLGLTPDEIFKVLGKYIASDKQAEAYQDLMALFSSPVQEVVNQVHLVDQLSLDRIRIYDAISWTDLIKDLGAILIQNQVIEARYIDHLLEEMPEVAAYSVLKQHIALPHSAPENGAKDVGICLGVVKEGIPVPGQEPVHLVVLLASDDKKKHIDLIFELLSLANTAEARRMETMESAQAIRQAIIEFDRKNFRNRGESFVGN